MDSNLDGKSVKTFGPLYYQKTHTVTREDRKHKYTFTYDLTEDNIFPIKWDKKDADLHLNSSTRTLARRVKTDFGDR
jgi:hypothetical protein